MDGVSAVLTPAGQAAVPGALPRGALVLVAVLLAAACRAAPAPLAPLLDSPDELAHEVLEALAARDRTRLAALAMTEAEFRARVWPELPASRPERNLTAGYVWNDLTRKSDGSLRGVLSTHGGKRYTLRRLEFAGETTNYGTFSVSRDTELIVVDEAGAEHRIRAFGSVLRADGGVKVFSYVVD
jgi:hypothetical protein